MLGGRASGDAQNANVLVISGGSSDPIPASDRRLCSGYVVHPRLVLTARHCVMRSPEKALNCLADGTPVDFSADAALLSPQQVTVGFGSDQAALQKFSTVEILAAFDITTCRSDVAFLRMSEDLPLSTRARFRRTPVAIGDALVFTGGATPRTVRPPCRGIGGGARRLELLGWRRRGDAKSIVKTEACRLLCRPGCSA